MSVLIPIWKKECRAHLASTCAIIARESSGDAVCGGQYLTELLAVYIFGISSHAGYRDDLLVLLHSLLQLAKEDTETWRVC
jgi:hypothetical protein